MTEEDKYALKEFVGAVVEKQVNKAFEKLPIPKINIQKFKF